MTCWIKGEFAVDRETYNEQGLYPDKIIDLNEWLSLLNGKAIITEAEPLENEDFIGITWAPVIDLGEG